MTLGPVGIALFGLVLATALATAAFRDVLAVIIVFAAYSLGMAIFYAVLLAPDVAMTEAAIGAGVTTLLLLLTIAKTARPGGERVVESIHWPAVAVVGSFTLVLLATVASFPELGSDAAPAVAEGSVTDYYLSEALDETGVENAVTAVLAGYRGFDTFGEAVVVFAAALAVLVVLDTEVFTGD